MANRVVGFVHRYAATIGFLILSGMVVLALYLSYRQSQDRQQQIDDLTTATQYICEVATLIDAATVQLRDIDIDALDDRGNTPGENQRLQERVSVFEELHVAFTEGAQACRGVE